MTTWFWEASHYGPLLPFSVKEKHEQLKSDCFDALTAGGWNLRQWWSQWRVWGCLACLRSCGAPVCVWPGTEPDSSPPWTPSVGCPSFPPPAGSGREKPGWSWVWETGLWHSATLASSPQHRHLAVNLRRSRERRDEQNRNRKKWILLGLSC